MQKIKVLIVDDSALVREMLSKMLSEDPMIDVVGEAYDPYDAREKIKALHPDVLTLDIEMPKMDGVTFLKNLMRLHPLPVVMISTLTEKGADVTFEAIDLGAIDFVTKPKIDLKHTFEDYALEIRRKVKMASKVSKGMLENQYSRYLAAKKRSSDQSSEVHKIENAPVASLKATYHGRGSKKIIALGASTGGTEAIKEVLIRLPEQTPAIVITQHIPEAFSEPFAKRMDGLSKMFVHHAQDGQEILPGHVYIAPGNRHLEVVQQMGKYVCKLNNGEPVNRHKPSVDVMFDSVIRSVGKNSIGVILTGMGADGARGLKRLKDIGVPTIAQDEKTSVVWGMPGESVRMGAAEYVLPLEKVAAKLSELAEK